MLVLSTPPFKRAKYGVSGGGVNVGELVHDGPATPEQISLYLPLTGTVDTAAVATCRYRVQGDLSWTTGHPLHRIRPDLAVNSSIVDAGFAWPIIDLAQGTTYEVEVTVTLGAASVVKTLTCTTRTLPAASGAANKNVNAGMTPAQIQTALNALVPGDVLEFANGTYDLSSVAGGVQLDNVHGTNGSPIYIRGESRAGVTLSHPARLFKLIDVSNLVFEKMSWQGSGVDSGTDASSNAVTFWSTAPAGSQKRLTFRNLAISGVDTGIDTFSSTPETLPEEMLIYDCTLLGNNVWTDSFVNTNTAWNDSCLMPRGKGNCAFNNTIKGFGDSIKLQFFTGANYGIHFYRNDIRNSCDDAMEFDGARRNCTAYDNRIHNAMSMLSLDPLDGGPLLCTRNIGINLGRTPFKFNDTNTGHYIYNNTMVRTEGKYWHDGIFTAEAAWYNDNVGAQRAVAFRNNVLIYFGPSTQTLRLDDSVWNPIDWDHNSFYPDGFFKWFEFLDFANLAAAQSSSDPIWIPTTPLFSGNTRRQVADTICESQPWVTPIVLGSDYLTEVLSTYTPQAADGTAIRNNGVAISGITDGYSGAAPDRGAIISGRSVPAYGDRS